MQSIDRVIQFEEIILSVCLFCQVRYLIKHTESPKGTFKLNIFDWLTVVSMGWQPGCLWLAAGPREGGDRDRSFCDPGKHQSRPTRPGHTTN